MTDVVTKANNLFEDGIQIGDFSTIISDVITRLKNKFLEFDGIGSVLAGGALIAGLLKIKSTATSVYEKLKNLKNLRVGEGINAGANGSHGGIDSSQRVTTMTVQANTVNVNGRVMNNGGTAGNRRVGNQAYVDNYYKRRGEILTGQSATSPTTVPTSKGFGTIAKNVSKTAGGAGALTLAFGAMDVISTRSTNEERITAAKTAVDEVQKDYDAIMVNPERQAELPQATQKLQQATADLKAVQKDAIKNNNESLFATGGAAQTQVAQAKTAQFEKEDRQQRTGGTSLANDYSKNFQAVNGDSNFALETQKSGRESFWKGINDFFSGIGNTAKNDSAVRMAATSTNNPVTATDVGNSGFNPITGQPIILPSTTDFKMPELNIGAKIRNEIDFVSNTISEKIENLKTSMSETWSNFNISDYLPDFDISEWFSEKFSGIESPDFSQMWADFNISDFLPDIDISGWISEKFSGIEIPDISALLPDFSTITAPASEAFNSISTSASETWISLQTSWNELPNFFSGIFGGLGGIATSAGSAIVSGINSAIGTIQSAWESLSSWLSEKISSLSSMASNAVSSIKGAITGGGNVSPKAEGGFITSPQHILAGEAGTEVIIPLATSRRSRAMDLLKKAAAIVGGDSINITGDKFKNPQAISVPKFDELGNVKGYNGIVDNVITADDDLQVRRAKQEKQLEQHSKQPFPEMSFSEPCRPNWRQNC